MRTGLLSDLAIVGYEIFLDGDNVKLHYQKTDTPPDTVRPLIDELRKCKAEVVNILKADSTITHVENTQPRANVDAVWSPSIQALVDWFFEFEPPTEPFYLEPHMKVIDPAKFFAILRQEIRMGPSCPRGRMGTLQSDLRKLKSYLN